MTTATEATLKYTLKPGQSLEQAVAENFPGLFVRQTCLGMWIGNTNDPTSFDGNYYHTHEVEPNTFELHLD